MIKDCPRSSRIFTFHTDCHSNESHSIPQIKDPTLDKAGKDLAVVFNILSFINKMTINSCSEKETFFEKQFRNRFIYLI